MEDTCKGKDCWLFILMSDLTSNAPEIKNCPFYQEMIFTPQAIGEKVETAKVVKDCTNKRSLLVLLEDILPRMVGVQKSQEEMRNQSSESVSAFLKVLKVLPSNDNIIDLTKRIEG